jgi:hypothetical protein
MNTPKSIPVPKLVDELSAENSEAAAALVLSLVAGLARKHPEVAQQLLAQLVEQLKLLQNPTDTTSTGGEV